METNVGKFDPQHKNTHFLNTTGLVWLLLLKA